MNHLVWYASGTAPISATHKIKQETAHKTKQNKTENVAQNKIDLNALADDTQNKTKQNKIIYNQKTKKQNKTK